jgi:hypothetical protein
LVVVVVLLLLLCVASGNESHLCSCGKVTVAELDWSVPAHYEVCSLRLPKERGVVVGVVVSSIIRLQASDIVCVFQYMYV